MSAKDRLVTNVDALETLAQLAHEGRTANAEERNKLGKFRGWGGVDMTDVRFVDGLLRKGHRWDSSRRENVTDVANPYYRLGMVIKSLDPDGKRGVFESIKQAAERSILNGQQDALIDYISELSSQERLEHGSNEAVGSAVNSGTAGARTYVPTEW